MAEISINDSGSIAAVKMNSQLSTTIDASTYGSGWASQINAKVGSGLITDLDYGSTLSGKIGGLDTIRVMTFNVGHFSDVGSASPSFTESQYIDYRNRFTALLNVVNADIILVQEYTINVYQSNAAKDVLFGNYPYYTIGSVGGDSIINAVFSKLPYTFIREQNFSESNVSSRYRYYQLLELAFGGHTIGIVNAHLDTTKSGNNYRFEQFGEIVDALKGYDCAIYGSDSNVARVQDDGLGAAQWNVINYWVNGGNYDLGNIYGTKSCGSGYGGGLYSLANNPSDPIGTWPTTRCQFSGYAALSCPCDNIVAKGFSISNVTRIDSTDTPSNDLSDHCVLFADLTFIR